MDVAVRLKEQHDAEREQFLDNHPGLFEALRQAAQHETLFDLLCKFQDRRHLSDAQVRLALKIGRELSTPKTNEKQANAPTGRVMIRGTIVNARARNETTAALVMTVKVPSNDGAWLAWGSVPDALVHALQRRGDVLQALRGCEVEFRATVKHSERHGPSWGFYSNPRSTRLVKVGVHL